MKELLDSDIRYRILLNRKTGAPQLAGQLNELATHLLLWLARYEAWIPDNPSHSLIYVTESPHSVKLSYAY